MTTSEKALGDAIAARLGGVKLDARAKAAAREFLAVHGKYAAAYDVAAVKEFARRAALAAVGAADEALDVAVGRLADKLIGAGMTKRTKPFGAFSSHSVTSLCMLAYAKEVAECGKLTRAIRKAKPPADALAACAAVERAAAAVTTKLAAYDGPQKAWQKAITARDAHLVPWQKSLTRLRVLAKASLLDDEGAYDALLAAPDAITMPKQTRKPKRPATPAPQPVMPT